jgi:hypothetical protein
VVSGTPTVCPMTPRAMVEAQFVTALVGDSASSDVSKEDVYSTPRKDLPEAPIQNGLR